MQFSETNFPWRIRTDLRFSYALNLVNIDDIQASLLTQISFLLIQKLDERDTTSLMCSFIERYKSWRSTAQLHPEVRLMALDFLDETFRRCYAFDLSLDVSLEIAKHPNEFIDGVVSEILRKVLQLFFRFFNLLLYLHLDTR